VNVLKNIETPTGNILIVQGHKGKLEMLSLGDYGQAKNIKADFLGLSRELEGVPHGDLLPLTEKWVLTISSQYGCSIGCEFCDVPRVGPGANASLNDLQGQILTGLHLHPEIKSTKRLNVHFARMGEPTYNPAVLDCGKWLHDHVNDSYRVHPVVSTMMPSDNEWLKTFIHTWMRIKNRVYEGNAGLQISVNSTSEEERRRMFRGKALRLFEIARLFEGVVPFGRKIALNFALAGYEIDEQLLAALFSPEMFMCKITPMHETAAVKRNGLETVEGYTSFKPYQDVERRLKSVGFDVIVFVPSKEEDESRITCGNAILADKIRATRGGRI